MGCSYTGVPALRSADKSGPSPPMVTTGEIPRSASRRVHASRVRDVLPRSRLLVESITRGVVMSASSVMWNDPLSSPPSRRPQRRPPPVASCCRGGTPSLSDGGRQGRVISRCGAGLHGPIDAYTIVCESYTQRCPTRTNIEIDDRLMQQALRNSGARTKRAVVEEALRLLIQTKGQKGIRHLRGKVNWEGNLNVSRLERLAK